MIDTDSLLKDFENLKNKKIKMLESDNYIRAKVIEIIDEMLIISDTIFTEYGETAAELKTKISKKAAILDFVKKIDNGGLEFYNEIKDMIEIKDDEEEFNDICTYMKDEIEDYKDDLETLTADNESSDNSDLDFIVTRINSYNTIYGRINNSFSQETHFNN